MIRSCLALGSEPPCRFAWRIRDTLKASANFPTIREAAMRMFLATVVFLCGAMHDCAAQEMPTLKGHKNSITCLAFSKDGKLLASGAKDGTAIIWDVKA